MRFKDLPFRIKPKKGTSKKKRRALEQIINYYAIKAAPAIKQSMIDELLYGESTIKVIWNGNDLEFIVSS